MLIFSFFFLELESGPLQPLHLFMRVICCLLAVLLLQKSNQITDYWVFSEKYISDYFFYYFVYSYNYLLFITWLNKENVSDLVLWDELFCCLSS